MGKWQSPSSSYPDRRYRRGSERHQRSRSSRRQHRNMRWSNQSRCIVGKRCGLPAFWLARSSAADADSSSPQCRPPWTARDRAFSTCSSDSRKLWLRLKSVVNSMDSNIRAIRDFLLNGKQYGLRRFRLGREEFEITYTVINVTRIAVAITCPSGTTITSI